MSELREQVDTLYQRVCQIFGVDPDNAPGMANGQPQRWIYLGEVYGWLKAGWEPDWIMEALRPEADRRARYDMEPPPSLRYLTKILARTAEEATKLPEAPEKKPELSEAERREKLVEAAYLYRMTGRWNIAGVPSPDNAAFPRDILAEAQARYDAKFKMRRFA